ncbi:MAG TPA: ABC transporter permease [Acidobacteriaceae bacterium]|nr:ABC transporter permease [Acidobacteriaceae bacterium]
MELPIRTVWAKPAAIAALRDVRLRQPGRVAAGAWMESGQGGHWRCILARVRDLRLALRQLRKAPGFSLTIVLTFALGIGSATGIFSLVEGVLLRPLAFRNPERLVLVGDRLGDGLQLSVTAPEVATWEQAARAFSSMGAYITTSWELSGGPLSQSVNGARLTAGVFPTLGIAPMVGRVFTQREDDAHAPVVVISYAL